MKPEAGQLTVNDRIAIGKAASFLRFQAAYSVDATPSARQEWRSTAEVLTEIERRCQPQPAEDPDEWVILDPMKYADHVLRKNIDFTNTRTGWEPISIWGGDTIGGVMNDYKGERVLFRCRRCDLPKIEQVEPDHVPDATKKISDESLELIAHLRDQMQLLANRVAECERVVFAQTPQPQKTRVRLWMRNEPKGRPSLFACDERPYPDSHKYVEILLDSEGFYVENQS